MNLWSPGAHPSSPLLTNCRHLGLADTVAIVSLVALVAPWACRHHRCCCCCTCSPPTCKVYTCSARCLHCQWSRSRRQQKTEASLSEPLLSSPELSTVVYSGVVRIAVSEAEPLHCCQRRAPAHSDFPFIAPSLTLILDMTPAAVISSVSYILHCCQPGAYAHFYFPSIASLVPQPTCASKLTYRYMSVGDPVVESMRAWLAGSEQPCRLLDKKCPYFWLI